MEQIGNTQVGGNTQPMPVAQPMPVVQPMPVAQPMPQMAMGGMDDMGSGNGAFIKKGGSIKEFFNDINILDVTISAFVIGGIFYAIYYYKYMMMMEKTAYVDISTRIQKIESALAAQKAELNAAGKMDKMSGMRKRPLMRLG
jgi:hypothetical protein